MSGAAEAARLLRRAGQMLRLAEWADPGGPMAGAGPGWRRGAQRLTDTAEGLLVGAYEPSGVVWRPWEGRPSAEYEAAVEARRGWLAACERRRSSERASGRKVG